MTESTPVNEPVDIVNTAVDEPTDEAMTHEDVEDTKETPKTGL